MSFGASDSVCVCVCVATKPQDQHIEPRNTRSESIHQSTEKLPFYGQLTCKARQSKQHAKQRRSKERAQKKQKHSKTPSAHFRLPLFCLFLIFKLLDLQKVNPRLSYKHLLILETSDPPLVWALLVDTSYRNFLRMDPV